MIKILDRENVRKFLIKHFEKSIPMQIEKQPSSNTCWAACYKMVDRYYQVNRNWCFYINQQTQKCQGVNCNKPSGQCNQTRPIAFTLSDWNALGYNNTIHKKESLCMEDVREYISQGHPIQAFLKYQNKKGSYDNVGHFIMIVGTSRTSNFSDTTLVVLDPLKDQVECIEPLHLNFGKHWCETWIIAPKRTVPRGIGTKYWKALV